MALLISAGTVWGQKKDINSADIYDVIFLNPSSDNYNGKARQITALLEDQGTPTRELLEGTHFNLFINGEPKEDVIVKDAKTYTIRFDAIGDLYEGTKTSSFTILPENMDAVVVTGINASYDYTGSQIVPVITAVTLAGTTITTDDYIVEMGENINVSTGGTVTLKPANGNFIGNKVINFSINAKPLTNSMFSVVAKDYNGTAITLQDADITAKDGEATLVMGTDYTVKEYSNNTNAGTATVILQGIGNYTGESGAVNFTINKVALSEDMFTVASKEHTGQPILLTAADIFGRYNNVDLILDQDFTGGNYQNNTDKGVNTASVDFTGSNNFTGTVTKNFTITEENLEADMFTAIADKVYTGSPINLENEDITAMNGDNPLVLGTDYAIGTYKDNVNVGTATVTFAGQNNYHGTVGPISFQITPASLTADAFTIADKTYTGAPVTLTATDITAKFGDTDLVLGTDYEIGTYSNNMNAGQATVTFIGKNNFTNAVTTPVTFNITAANTSGLTVVTIPDQTETGGDIKPEPVVKIGDVTLVKDRDYKLEYPDAQYTEKGPHSIVIKPKAPNMTGSDITITYNIVSRPPQENDYTVDLQIGAGIQANYQSGNIVVSEGDNLEINFSTDDPEATAENIILLVDGVDTEFRSFGSIYRFTLADVHENHTIVISLREYTVTLPEVERAQVLPGVGVHEVTYGDSFTFSLVLDDAVDVSKVRVYANGELLTPTPVLSTTLNYIIAEVTEPVIVTVEGTGDPTGNDIIPTGIKVYNQNGGLVIETTASYKVQIYGLTGLLVDSQLINGYKSFALPKGLYIVKVDKEVHKIMINN